MNTTDMLWQLLAGLSELRKQQAGDPPDLLTAGAEIPLRLVGLVSALASAQARQRR